MPLTLSHPVLVLPLARTGLPLSALVAGSMAPDLPVVLHAYAWIDRTHRWSGVVGIDLVVGLVGTALWVLAGRHALRDVLPTSLRARWPVPAPWSRRTWLLAVPAVLVGASTHVVWDAFTHPGRWGTRLVPWLADVHGGLAGASWAQYVSSAVGLVVLLAVVAMAAARATPQPPAEGDRVVLGPAWLAAGLVVPLVAGLAAGLAALPDGPYAAAFATGSVGVLAGLVTGLVVSLAWVLRRG